MNLSAHRGFTLIEILLVLTMIGFMLGMISLNPGNQAARSVPGLSKELLLSLRAASSEALSQGETLGARVDANRLSYFRFDNVHNRWNSIEEKPLQAIVLTEGLQIGLRNKTNRRAHRSVAVGLPDIIFMTNGEISEFSLVLSVLASTGSSQISRVVHSDGLSLTERPL